MNEILVTGGLGYIGAHTALALVQNGYKVVIIDKIHESAKSANKIAGTINYQADILDKPALQQIFTKHKFTSVLHFAGLISVGESVEKPELYYQNNVTGSMNLLEVMQQNSVSNIVFSSSAAVYGNPEKEFIDENHRLAPINPYGRNKLIIEWLLADYAAATGLKHCCLRYFNAAGADASGDIGERHEPETHLIPLLLQAATGKISGFSMFGNDYNTADGSCIRDFIHVSDLAAAHVKALEYMENGGHENIFNLGTGHGFSVKEVITAAENFLGKKIPVTVKARRSGDSTLLVANSDKAQKILGIKNQFSAIENILKTAHNFMQKNQ